MHHTETIYTLNAPLVWLRPQAGYLNDTFHTCCGSWKSSWSNLMCTSKSKFVVVLFGWVLQPKMHLTYERYRSSFDGYLFSGNKNVAVLCVHIKNPFTFRTMCCEFNFKWIKIPYMTISLYIKTKWKHHNWNWNLWFSAQALFLWHSNCGQVQALHL